LAAQRSQRRRFVLAVVLLGQVMITAALGSVNIALPAISDDLGASGSQAQWLVALYQLGFACSLVSGGRLGDIFGARRVFVLGLCGFLIATILGAVATTTGVLMAGRLLQGLTAGVASPQVLSLIQRSFAGEDRRKALSLYAVASGTSIMLGQLITGALIEIDPFALGWRSALVYTAVVGAIALSGALLVIPRDASPESRRELDVGGNALLTVGALLLLYPLIQGRSQGWPPEFLVLAGGSVPVFALLYFHERRLARLDRDPVLHPSLLSMPTFRAGLATAFVFGMMSFPVFVLLTIALQAGFGYEPLATALITAPASIGVLAASFIAGRWGRRLGRTVFVIGAAVYAVSGLVFTGVFELVSPLGTAGWLVPMLVFGVGQGMSISPMMVLALSDVPAPDAGAASGVMQSVMQVSGAMGIGLFGTIFYAVVDGGSTRRDYIDALEVCFVVMLVFCAALLALHWPRRPQATAGTLRLRRSFRSGAAAPWHARSSAP
jgi:MFS family permease